MVIEKSPKVAVTDDVLASHWHENASAITIISVLPAGANLILAQFHVKIRRRPPIRRASTSLYREVRLYVRLFSLTLSGSIGLESLTYLVFGRVVGK
jgi:hypothetical protein